MQTHDGVLPTNLKASKSPLEAINKVAYPGQAENLKRYRSGYENYFENLPDLDNETEFLQEKTELSISVLDRLAEDLKCSPWLHENVPGKDKFIRTILGMEDPKKVESYYEAGRQVITAQWGDGFSSPVHGHTTGLLYEKLLFGTIRVNTYRLHDELNGIVRPVETVIADKNSTDIAALFTPHSNNATNMYKRQSLIHNFTSVGYSASLHYVPEYTRDGRDNTFEVQHFEDVWDFYHGDVTRIDSLQGMYLRPGDVALVRSQNVPEYGDHYIVITGHPVLKPHGLRPQDKAIHAPHISSFLDEYEPRTGLVLLKLNTAARKAFLSFHGIEIKDGKVLFPHA